MSREERKYSRVYHDAQDDERFILVWASDACLALWLRLLVLADGTWPAPAPIPRSAKARALSTLVDAGLVELVSGDLYRIHGLTAERSRRSNRASHAAAVRWHSDSSADSNATGIASSSAAGNAQVMLAKTSIEETSKQSVAEEWRARESRPKPNSIDRDPEKRAMREAIVARNGHGMDEPTIKEKS